MKWIYVKDVPNPQLRHIRLENNENKPVTNSRDTQEVPNDKGLQVLDILHAYKHTTSIFDDFIHYEKRQVEEGSKKVEPNESHYDSDEGRPSNQYRGSGGGGGGDRNHYNKGYRSHFKDYRSNFKDYRSNYNNQDFENRRGGGDDSSASANKMLKSGRNYSSSSNSRGAFMSRDRESPRTDRDDFIRDGDRDGNRDGNRDGYRDGNRGGYDGDRDGNRAGYDYRVSFLNSCTLPEEFFFEELKFPLMTIYLLFMYLLMSLTNFEGL